MTANCADGHKKKAGFLFENPLFFCNSINYFDSFVPLKVAITISASTPRMVAL